MASYIAGVAAYPVPLPTAVTLRCPPDSALPIGDSFVWKTWVHGDPRIRFRESGSQRISTGCAGRYCSVTKDFRSVARLAARSRETCI